MLAKPRQPWLDTAQPQPAPQPGAQPAPSTNGAGQWNTETPGQEPNIQAGGSGSPALDWSINTAAGNAAAGSQPNSNPNQAFVDQNIQKTQHRQANQSDYDYWIPKFDAAGGLGDGSYWASRMTDPEGSGSNVPEGNPSGVGGGANNEFSNWLQGQYQNVLGSGGPNQDKFNQLWGTLNDRASQDQTKNGFESVRETVDRSRKGQLAQIRGELADRGLISEPGHAQGPEMTSYGNLEDSLGGQYATLLRQLGNDQFNSQNQTLSTMGSLLNGQNSTTAGLYGSAGNLANGMTNSQVQLQLGLLSNNREWNQFLAQLGLDRDTLTNQINQGNADQALKLIQAFNANSSNANAGYQG